MPDWRGGEFSRKKEKPKREFPPVSPQREKTTQPQGKPEALPGKPVVTRKKIKERKKTWAQGATSGSLDHKKILRGLSLWVLAPGAVFVSALLIYVASVGNGEVERSAIPLLMVLASENQPSELGALGDPDSKGTLNSVAKVLRPKSSILSNMREDPQNWLQKLSDDLDARSFFKASNSSQTLLRGGGASSNLIAFYVNCHIVRRDQELTLVCDSSEMEFPSPCESSNTSKKQLSLKESLKYFAQLIPEDCFAMVGFDVRTPTPIHNLGDIGFPADIFQAAFDSLTKEEKQKLVLFLPCGQGQESWVMPSHSMSVFGFYFLEALSDQLEGNDFCSVGDFDEVLRRKVFHWVSRNRNSHQEPVRIGDEETWKRIQSEKFVGFFYEHARGEQKKDVLDTRRFSTRYKELNSLWKQYEEVTKDRMDPDKFPALASLESHLLFLEEMVELQSANCEQMLMAAENLLKQLKPVRREYQVSRFEDQKTEDDPRVGNKDLENHIFEILRAEIDPDSRNDESKNNRAEEKLELLMERWAELQRLACHPRRELAWWMHDHVIALDNEFLWAVDEFTANHFERCGDLLVKAKTSIDKAKKYQVKLRECMDFRDDATSLLPHAMAFLLRMEASLPPTVQNKTPQELVEQAKHLAIIALEVERIENLLSEPTADQQKLLKLEVEEAPRSRLKAFKEWVLLGIIKSWLEDEKVDAEAIRRLRIAVRYPFLPNDMRKRAYHKLAQRFEEECIPSQEARASDQSRTESNRSSSIVTDAFLDQLAATGASQELQAYWKTVLQEDLRSSRFWKIELAQPSKYRELYENVRKVRRVLGSIGMHSVSHGDMLTSTCAGRILDSYGALNELKYRYMQQERLLVAGWGSQEMDLAQFEGDFPFLDFARKYSSGFEEVRKRILPAWDFQEQMQEDLDNRFLSDANLLKEMSRWLKTEIGEDAKLQVNWTPSIERNLLEAWESIRPTVKIAMNTLSGNASLVSLSQKASEHIRYPADQDMNSADIDVMVAFRGHRIKSQAMSKQVLYASNFQPQPQSEIIASMKKAKRSVVILLDCSDSMDSERMKQSKELVTDLINTLQEQVLTGLEIEVSLVVFGILSTEEELKRYQFAPSKIANKNLGFLLAENGSRFCSVAHTEFYPIKADEQTRTQWANYLSAPFVAPAIHAPLYDAIDFAYSHLPPETSMDVRELVIFGDGANNLVPAISYDSIMNATKGSEGAKVAKVEKPYYLNVLQQIPEKLRKTKLSYEGPSRQLPDVISQLDKKNPRIYLYDCGRIGDGKGKQESRSFEEELLARDLLPKSTVKANITFDGMKQGMLKDFALPQIKVSYVDSSSEQETAVSFLEESPTSIRPAPISLKVFGNSSFESPKKRPEVIEAFPGQVIRVESDIRGNGLNFKSPQTLRENNPLSANLVSKLDMGKVNNASNYKMTWEFQKAERRNGKFDLLVELRREQEWDPPSYMPWPKFAVGKLLRKHPSGNATSIADAILFTDLDFEKKHYPTLKFRVEKLKDDSWDLTAGTLDLWWSFSSAQELFGNREDIRTKVKSDLSSKKFRNCSIARKDGSIQVERELQVRENAYQWILCPDAAMVSREYRIRAGKENRWSEVHTFELPLANATKEVDMYIFSEEDVSYIAEDSVSEKSPIFWYTGETKPRSQ